jgi:hypothetical protein
MRWIVLRTTAEAQGMRADASSRQELEREARVIQPFAMTLNASVWKYSNDEGEGDSNWIQPPLSDQQATVSEDDSVPDDPQETLSCHWSCHWRPDSHVAELKPFVPAEVGRRPRVRQRRAQLQHLRSGGLRKIAQLVDWP